MSRASFTHLGLINSRRGTFLGRCSECQIPSSPRRPPPLFAPSALTLHLINLQVRSASHSMPPASNTRGSQPRGGGGTASLTVGTHCQTTAPAFRRQAAFRVGPGWAPVGPDLGPFGNAAWALSFFLPAPIFEDHRPRPPEITFSIQTQPPKVTQSLLNSFLYKECHVIK